MKKILSIILLLFIISCVGCEDIIENEFIEPEGYTIVYVKQDYGNSYGYIQNKDLELYTKGQLEKVKILYPYKGIHEEQFIIIDVETIRSINIGAYK